MMRRQVQEAPMPRWFKPFLVVLAGMIVLVLAGAPRDAAHPDWRDKIARPMELSVIGAVLLGIGVYWWFALYHQRQPKRRGKR
jgi:hypothetical protein